MRLIRNGRQLSGLLCMLAAAWMIGGCSTLGALSKAVGVQNPKVDVVGARLSGLSFDAADFDFDIRVQNPNSVGVTLAGLDYDFLVNGTSFLKGTKDEKVELLAQGEHTTRLPVSVGFASLYQMIAGLKNEDQSSYELKCGLSFDLPVVGRVRIPVSAKGELPHVKLPSISLDALKLIMLNLTGADLEMRMRVNNPNAFSMLIDGLNYKLDVSGKTWVSGVAEQAIELKDKGQNVVRIPVSLNFLQVGQSAYNLISGNGRLAFDLSGSFDASGSFPQLKQAINLPFAQTGLVDVIR